MDWSSSLHNVQHSQAPVTPTRSSRQTASQLLAAFSPTKGRNALLQPPSEAFQLSNIDCATLQPTYRSEKQPHATENDSFVVTPQKSNSQPIVIDLESGEVINFRSEDEILNLQTKRTGSKTIPVGIDVNTKYATHQDLSPVTTPTWGSLSGSLLERRSSAGRSLRPRRKSGLSLGGQENALSLATSPKAHVRIVKGVILNAAKSSRIEITDDEFTESIKVKRDNFFGTKKDLFLPLLPSTNYIQKLIDAPHSTEESIIPNKILKDQPQGITATMKPFQLSGLSFLVWLHDNGMSGLLCDEMGLGKTLQTLSLLQYLKELPQKYVALESRPSLVVCPLSVLYNWTSEALKFVPSLKVMTFYGSSPARAFAKRDLRGKGTVSGSRPKYDLVVTTYQTFNSEQTWFKRSVKWHYVILDEGHTIKNSSSQGAAALRGLNAQYRLILTGTPIQNHLLELWSLLNWLYPQVFAQGTDVLFRNAWDLTRGNINTSTMEHAVGLLECVMLRRTKDSPGVDLKIPPKTEVFLFVPLTQSQRSLYLALIQGIGDITGKDTGSVKGRSGKIVEQKPFADEEAADIGDAVQTIKKAVSEGMADGNRKTSTWARFMNLVMHLRRVCSHPYLIAGVQPDPYFLGDHVIHASGKFIVLSKFIDELVLRKGRKMLIFSEWTGLLDCVEEVLHMKGGNGKMFRYSRLDGSTPRARRNFNIRMFQDARSDFMVMLTAIKAGGQGVNLTAASDVVFLDEVWNPQITLQAEARAHRIGQEKPITIYKLCTQGTVEQQMIGRTRKKLYLSEKTIGAMKNIHELGSLDQASSSLGTVSEDVPQFTMSHIKAMLRKDAEGFAQPAIDVKELLSWSFEAILSHCHDKDYGLEEPEEVQTEAQHDLEQEWLSVVERVKCADFEGAEYRKSVRSVEAVPEELERATRRIGKETTVMVDGYAVSKESMICGNWEAVPTLAGKDSSFAEPKRPKKEVFGHQSYCQICRCEGQILNCSGCPRSYHENCLEKPPAKTAGRWHCPQHHCVDCKRNTTDAGGMLLRCRDCARAYCDECLDWDRTTFLDEQLVEYEELGYLATVQATFVQCVACNKAHGEESPPIFKQSEARLVNDSSPQTAANAHAHAISTQTASSPSSLTNGSSVTSSGPSTPNRFTNSQQVSTSSPSSLKRKMAAWTLSDDGEGLLKDGSPSSKIQKTYDENMAFLRKIR